MSCGTLTSVGAGCPARELTGGISDRYPEECANASGQGDCDALVARARCRHVWRQGLKLHIEHEGLREFATIHMKAANRISVAPVTLGGLYLAASLLMQHSLGPMVGGVLILSILNYAAAVYYTVRLIHAIDKGL